MCFSVPKPSALSISDLGCDLGGWFALAPAASPGLYPPWSQGIVGLAELSPGHSRVPFPPSTMLFPHFSSEPHLFIPQVSSVSTSYFSAWTLAAAEQNLCLPPAMICTRGSNDPDTSGRVGERRKRRKAGDARASDQAEHSLREPSSFHSLPECLGSHGTAKDREYQISTPPPSKL